MSSKRLVRTIGAVVCGALISIGLTIAPAQAFTSSSSATASGVTYKASATTCWFYSSIFKLGCDWDSTTNVSKSMTYNHKAEVKANGAKVKVEIKKGGGISISGNSTSLVKLSDSVTGKSNAYSGNALPGLSISVAARTVLAVGSNNRVATGWTTW